MAHPVLIPGNWLYNAGVIGFLRVMEAVGEEVEKWLREDGGVDVPWQLVRDRFQKADPDLAGTVLEGFSEYWWHFIDISAGPAAFDVCGEFTLDGLLKMILSDVKKGGNKKSQSQHILWA